MSDGSCNLVRVTTKFYEPQPITEADRAVIIRVMEEGMQGLGVPAAAIERGLGTLQFAEFYPAFHRLLSGPRGSIWAQSVIVVDSLSEQDRNTLRDFPGGFDALLANPHLLFGSRNWDVFDADGRFLGEATLPAGFTATNFVGEEIYGVWKNELEVQYVMRLKVANVRVPRVRFDDQGAIVDTVGWYTRPVSLPEAQIINVGASEYAVPRPTLDEPLGYQPRGRTHSH